jgi:hypothetical protein
MREDVIETLAKSRRRGLLARLGEQPHSSQHLLGWPCPRMTLSKMIGGAVEQHRRPSAEHRRRRWAGSAFDYRPARPAALAGIPLTTDSGSSEPSGFVRKAAIVPLPLARQ